METASSPVVLHALRIIPKVQLHSASRLPLFSTHVTFTRNQLNFRGKRSLQFKRFTASPSPSSSSQQNSSQQLAVLLEVEGVLMDVYRHGNRQAFNVAFKKLGLDCASWTEPIYLDLIRKSSGDEERMLILYFNRIGWPTSLPTSEKQTFTKSVLREKKNALDDLVMSKSLPLRPGVQEYLLPSIIDGSVNLDMARAATYSETASFLDDAFKEGIPVVILTAYSKSGDKIARSVVEKLGDDRISKIKMVGNEEVEQSFYGQLVFGKGMSSSLEEQLAKEARKAASAEKQRIAEEVASMLKLSVDIDTSSAESLQKILAALRAGAECAEVPVSNCVLVAGSQSGVSGAEQIGMPCIVLRSSLTSRAEFPSASAIMDGFGGADLTISRLRGKQWS
ncbi:CBBY-like protein isoform X1 [Diospyros lotus]|uniref:CBBY-like protein isoform X1 n=1 Tax=Diospyros lotus TaxID=55363 RepID=UPI0022548BC8|nr:CBBY-like protein isoform X1 [Diospyros lotus]